MQDNQQVSGSAEVPSGEAADGTVRRAFLAGINPRVQQEQELLDSLAALGFEVYLLSQKDLSCSLRELDYGRSRLTAYKTATDPAALPEPAAPYDAALAPKLPRGLLIMAGLDRAGLNQTLDQLREQKLTGLTLKAVATEHNLDWPVQALARELGREHCVTAAFVRLRRQVKKLPPPADLAQRQALEQAQSLLGNLAALTDDGPLLAALRQLTSAYGGADRSGSDKAMESDVIA
ncbi:DUF3783 domain-containing protein [Oscillospiraceae bacterium HV4-5-C5C]|nr:DUF3783 domain-containing protein [Oscillospiraceae bacterium HV4-5-C5C]